MSSLAFLVTELQSLASESRRKHPEIREAAEKSLAILRSSPEQATASLASDSIQSDDLLRPVFMGCATKNAKVVAISLGSLQRLISLKAVPQSAVALIVNTMSDAMSQGVDIQLRILQTLVSLITNFPSIHGELLGDALLLCFKLQDSRIAVVSSTAAATLRQLVMFIFEKMLHEDRLESDDSQQLSNAALPDGSTRALRPCAKDAFSVFEDLCLLANSEKPHSLKLDYLHKTFALELIESVLTNYHELFRKHSELLMLLQHHLCPLILKSLSDKHIFPLILRCTRVVFLILKQFSSDLQTEAEVFLMLLIRMISEDSEGISPDYSSSRPVWTRVLAMEIMRGVCSDAELIRNIWDRYDARQAGSNVFSSLIVALKRLVTEKPALLGVSTQMMGVGTSNAGDSSLDVGGVAGMVATAASATVSGVVGIIVPGAGLSVQNSAMKLQCIDQLDKADSPPIPEAYIYLLGVQCIISLCEGFASFTGPLYTSIMVQRPRAAGEPVVRAPAALDVSTLSQEDLTTRHLVIVRSMVENGWPALLAALSFIISTNLSDELFVDVLSSYQALTNVAGMLALNTPRDALFNSLSKFAIPSRVVSSLESYIEPPTPRSATSFTDNLGLTAPVQAPRLSERNLACLRVLISSALFLAGSLGESWYGILEALQNADYVLNVKGLQASPSRRMSTPMTPGRSVSASVSSEQTKIARHPLLVDIDSESVLAAIQRLFDASKNLEDSAFQDFTVALCKLSSEMVEMQSDGGKLFESEDSLSPVTLHRRRVSGIHLPRTTMRQGDFGVERLGSVALLNIHRLIYRAPEVAWNTTTSHLLWVMGLSSAPQSIRLQAARVLDEILIIVPRNLSSTGDLQPMVQRRVLDVLFKQIVPPPDVPATNTNFELRRTGLETLHQILQASGHTFVVGWGSIFEMLGSVCKPVPLSRSHSIESVSTLSFQETNRPLSLGQGYANDRSYTALVKIAFQSLKLVCDSVSLLSPEDLRLCIKTLGQFGRQADTNIALTAAESLLWSVSDSIQAKRKDAEIEPEYSALWMCLLLEVLGLCTDTRHEVRDGAIQTLFRAMQLYGATLTLDTWDNCIWKITFPLLDAISVETRRGASDPGVLPPTTNLATQSDYAWDESKSLALQSIGSIISEFLVTKIMHLETFSKAWSVFTTHIHDTVSLDRRTLSPPALLCLGKVVRALSSAEAHLWAKVSESAECVWKACSDMGSMVLQGGETQFSPRTNTTRLHRAFTQESLVGLVDVIRNTRSISLSQTGEEWPLERLSRVMEILKGVLTYPHSPDYRPDVDGLTPVQVVVLDAIADIRLTAHGVPSLIIRDLSEFITLPFLAAFHVPVMSLDSPATPTAISSQKQVTYIGLCKKVMPLIVELYMRFRDNLEIYEDGTLEAIFLAYSIPTRLKYECPAPSKFGKDLPLWKTATASFLRIVTDSIKRMVAFGDRISDVRVEGIWRQTIEVFRGGILADCSAMENFSLEDQEAEENFDLSLISSLEIDLVPHLGDTRVPDHLIVELAKVLHKGSQLYKSSMNRSHFSLLSSDTAKVSGDYRDSHDFETVDLDSGTTAPGIVVPRERFSFWCFDLLFLICSDITSDQESSRKRLAALCLPILLDRCNVTMMTYIADEAFRGNIPFPRVREDELLYVLRKIVKLRLWPGTLWAALSESPSRFASSQPPADNTLSPSALIVDVIRRSSVAHIFYFYSVLCEIASIARKVPSAWVVTSSSASNRFVQPHIGTVEEGDAVEVDARTLAREALKVLGKEMGAM